MGIGMRSSLVTAAWLRHVALFSGSHPRSGLLSRVLKARAVLCAPRDPQSPPRSSLDASRHQSTHSEDQRRVLSSVTVSSSALRIVLDLVGHHVGHVVALSDHAVFVRVLCSVYTRLQQRCAVERDVNQMSLRDSVTDGPVGSRPKTQEQRGSGFRA